MIKPRFVFLFIVLIALFGVLSLILTTRWGIGASPDSVVYIGGARSLASGQGFRYPSWEGFGEPITHFPPFYSMVLGLGDIIGIDALLGARILNSLLFTTNIIFFGLVFLRYGTRPNWLHLIGAFIVLTSIPMLAIHSMAWSEPLFLLLGFLSLILLAKHLHSQRIALLVLSGVVVGIAILTRYAGVAYLASGLLGLLLLGKGPFPKRITQGLYYGILGILPGLIWITYNSWVAGTATNREIIFHPIGLTRLFNGVKTIANWVLIPASLSPPLLSGFAFMVILLFLIVAYLFIRRENLLNEKSPLELWRFTPIFYRLLGFFILVYIGFLIFSISFIDANTPLDDRILSPVFWAGALLVLSFLDRLASSGIRYVSSIILFGALIFSLAYSLRAGRFVLDGFRGGLGMNSLVWQQSETIAQIKTLPIGSPIYSNAAEAIYLHTHHVAMRLPRKVERVTGQLNEEYESMLQSMQRVFSQDGGILVYFDFFQPGGYPSEEELVRLFALKILVETPDGTIYSSEIVQ